MGPAPARLREGGGAWLLAMHLLYCVPWELATFAEHPFSPLTIIRHGSVSFNSMIQLHNLKAYNCMRLSRFGVSEISTAATIGKGKRASLSTFCLVTVARLSVRKQFVLSVTFTCMRHTNEIPMSTMSGQSTCTTSVVPTECHGNKCRSSSFAPRGPNPNPSLP